MSERPDSTLPYRIRHYRPGDETAILALFNSVFGEDDPNFTPRTLDQWNWLFRDNPCGNQIVLAVENEGTPNGGRVIAQYACLPARAQLGDEVVIAGQGIDSMVHADYRRGLKREGPFLHVARDYFATLGRWPICGFGYGFPNRRAYPIGVRLIGYQPVVKPLPTLYRNFFESSDDGEVGRDHVDAAGAPRTVDVVELDSFRSIAGELDALWAAQRARYPMALVRDAAYLTWRYDACPWLHYRRFAVREKAGGALRGFFVTRSNWLRLPIQALVDLFGAPDDAALVALALRKTTELGRAANQARIEAWLPERSPFFGNALAAGFKSEPCQYVLCTMIYRDHPTVDWARDHWYYTIGDSDVF